MAQDVALVTGASSGIGEALARRLARDRHHLALVARRRDRLDVLANELRGAHGIDVHVIPVDLVRAGAIDALVAQTERLGLVVDWLVNNAGFGTAGRFDSLPVARELEEIRLNVAVPVELTSRWLPAMVARGRGVVMNVASLAAYMPAPYNATYGATKAFLLSFSEAIAAELRGTGVQVLCVCPGFTRTEFQEKAHVDTTRIPEFAWMSAAEVADQAVRAVGRTPVVVNGLLNSLASAALKIVPRGLVARGAAALMRPQFG